MWERLKLGLSRLIGPMLCLFTLAEVNYPNLTPQSQLAVFAMLGLVMVFCTTPLHPRWRDRGFAHALDLALILAVLFCFGYILIQTEPIFRGLWLGDQPLGNRAGMEHALDEWVGLLGLVLVLEATRRTIGWTLPLLSSAFIAYASFGASMPDWLFPHRGFPWERIVSQTFLHSQGVFGIALKVMFTYVFLFVIFGVLLEKTGATGFIIDFSRKIFGRAAGGPAKIAVLSSGMMGSLSGSAVANTATTGTFTIPLMRSSGFRPSAAAAVEAAASSGGALVPPVMGAGAYMMLEIIDPPVTYLQIIRAALIPAVLYYVALLLIVHFYAKRVGATGVEESPREEKPLSFWAGIVFIGAFAALIAILLLGFTPFRAVSLTLLVILLLSPMHRDTRIGFKELAEVLSRSAKSGVSLIAAASCVGIIIGVVTLTGVGAKLPGVLLPLAQHNLLLALLLLMFCTIVLGMGLPSAVCYLLMATLIGPILGDLGVVPMAAHLFIFYFGMMSMVTPPVALAAYTAGTIAGADIMRTSFTAFRFSLIGFALPFAFVIHPQLLMLDASGDPASMVAVFLALLVTLAGVLVLAAGISGYWFAELRLHQRLLLLASAFVFILVKVDGLLVWLNIFALLVSLAVGWQNMRSARSDEVSPAR